MAAVIVEAGGLSAWNVDMESMVLGTLARLDQETRPRPESQPAAPQEEEKKGRMVASDIYCKGELLHTVQMAKIFDDSKTFVDMKLRESPEVAIKLYHRLMKDTNNNPTHDQVKAFVNETFEPGNELMEWEPKDWSPNPALLSRIYDDKYRSWAGSLNQLWRKLARQVKEDIRDNPQLYSLVYVPNGFIIPGGRFTELYYWDTYWIVQGLLHCDMDTTVKGVIENLIALVKKYGFVPNGSRVYYAERSQPPLLIAMARAYFDKTQDLDFIKANIDTLEKEFLFWMNNALVDIEKDGKKYKLARYYFLSNGPRPESYSEDYEVTEYLGNDTAARQRMYWELKSGAASGWDFSTRWFIDDNGTNGGGLKDIKTTKIVPVDLNAILYGAARGLQHFKTLLKKRVEANAYGQVASQLREAVQAVFWNEQAGIWFDYDLINKKQREYFYGSNVVPLWTHCYDLDDSEAIALRVVDYLKKKELLNYFGGTPSSLIRSGEQWDFPNCWAPLQAFIIQGLDNTGQPAAQEMARELATRWLHANHVGFEETQMMFEKYDAENVGRSGGGGEYVVQEGFGWTNGLAFELLAKYYTKGGSSYGLGIPGTLAGSLPGLPDLPAGYDVSNSLSHAHATLDRVRKGLRGKEASAAADMAAQPQAAAVHGEEAG